MDNNFEKNEKFDFSKLVKENIEIAKTLSNLPEDKKEKVKKLLLKKKQIQIKNGFLSELRIQKINKKINKIREVFNEKT